MFCCPFSCGWFLQEKKGLQEEGEAEAFLSREVHLAWCLPNVCRKASLLECGKHRRGRDRQQQVKGEGSRGSSGGLGGAASGCAGASATLAFSVCRQEEGTHGDSSLLLH